MKLSTKTSLARFLSPVVVLAGLLAVGCPREDSEDGPIDVRVPGTAEPNRVSPLPTPKPEPAAGGAASTNRDDSQGPNQHADEPDDDAHVPAEKKSESAKKKHEGPWLWVRRTSAGIYAKPDADRDNKLGYVKRGGQVPIIGKKVEGEDCPRGWYEVASGGYICSHVGTTEEDDPAAKFAPRQPDIDDILPYPYARNAKNGTPLYKSIPTKEQMLAYEPYLPEAKKAQKAIDEKRTKDREQMRMAGLSLGGASGNDEEEIPLWEREEDLHEVTLEDLRKEADDVLAQRMMKGFYVAIDKTFTWHGRTWYKTTKGLIAPAERMWQTEGSDFHGVEIDGEQWQLPIAFVFGGVKTAPVYEIDEESKTRKVVGQKEKFEPVQLKYNYLQMGNIDYFEMADGNWIRDRHVRMTTPNPRPEQVGPNERWIDVDISEQTLVVFEGDRPVYATLISSGKESSIKAKDHSTPRGMWRVREKHVASTMDGNGTAAGDLPYSIEDVPYIMYFHKSYATHGAFWHRNYGVQMSHGCVNLAPLDAKWIFYYADPQLPEGYHGTWSDDERPGSWIVVHD